ncbi:hypothetical protein C6988_05300 [Nitrosopumilus sp. b1]|uniref:hypothetical protein n=1 Tax=Nitrosopumilus sp. b1 TaxID=2109907 RepID=UPI0015F6ECB5|nr:hypothetical protein [Nitrosopumilus sp. b1]KAF6243105.1 hypothetical protein C6988_05300 [Nitrosopumilus sp. b1]
MHTPSISFSFSFLNNLTQSFRIFLVTSIAGTYTLVLYELFPEFLFNPNYSLTYFVAPVAAIAGVLIGLPKFMNRGMKTAKPKAKKTENKSGEDLLNEIIGGDDSGESTQQGVQQDSTGVMAGNSEGVTLEPASVGGPNAELDALLGGGESNSSTVSADIVTSGGSISGLNEDTIRDMIDQKFEPVEKDLSSFKKDLNKIKEDMKITKENVDSLTESFEGTLTDMKAFQAEIANPLNFMRKYFESIDLKNLSDPSLPLRQQNRAPEQTVSQAPIPQPASQAPVSVPQPAPVPAPVTEQASQISPQVKPKTTEMESIEKGTDLDNPMDSVMKPLFSGTLSVSNLMSIVELAGEMLKENGDDCIDLLIEQCKLMGLKDEDENTIYNIIDMLKKSGMNVEDTLIQLYKFAKIVGINDKQADAHYKKLLESRDEEDD